MTNARNTITLFHREHIPQWSAFLHANTALLDLTLEPVYLFHCSSADVQVSDIFFPICFSLKNHCYFTEGPECIVIRPCKV